MNTERILKRFEAAFDRGDHSQPPENQAEHQKAAAQMLQPEGLAWNELPNGSNTIVISQTDLTKSHHPSRPLCKITLTNRESLHKGLIAIILEAVNRDEEITLEIINKENGRVTSRYANSGGNTHRQVYNSEGTETKSGGFSGPVYFDDGHKAKLCVGPKPKLAASLTTIPDLHTVLVLGINLAAEISHSGIHLLKTPTSVMPATRGSYRRISCTSFSFSKN